MRSVAAKGYYAVARVRRVAGVGVAAHHRMIAARCIGPGAGRYNEHDPRADASVVSRLPLLFAGLLSPLAGV